MSVSPLWVRWLTWRARQGSASALVSLGQLCETQQGPRGIGRANQLYLKAAEKGNAQAMWNLGVNYLGQKGGKADPEKALHWLNSACDQGHELALWAMGKMHLAGRLVEQDLQAGMALLNQAAEKGCDSACLALSDIYRHGRHGVDADQEQSLYWFRQAQPFWDRVWIRCGLKRITAPGGQ